MKYIDTERTDKLWEKYWDVDDQIDNLKAEIKYLRRLVYSIGIALVAYFSYLLG